MADRLDCTTLPIGHSLKHIGTEKKNSGPLRSQPLITEANGSSAPVSRTFALGDSDVMKRLQSFLPAMQESNRLMNEDISKGNASKYNLEAEEEDNDLNGEDTSDDDGGTKKKKIEMEFALGVWDKEEHGEFNDEDITESRMLPTPVVASNTDGEADDTDGMDGEGSSGLIIEELQQE